MVIGALQPSFLALRMGHALLHTRLLPQTRVFPSTSVFPQTNVSASTRLPQTRVLPQTGLAPVSWTGTDLGFKHSAAAVSSRS